MYDEDIDFYELSKTEQRRLIRSKRAATSNGLLKELPETRPAVRVFEKSLRELIFDRLESGRYTINELAAEFDVSSTDVRRIINKYRRYGNDSFTGESFLYHSLTERNGVIRVKQATGKQYHYSIEKIPYFARIADPTLTASLLSIDQYQTNFPTIVENIPEGTATEIDETYALLIGDFWDIEPQAVFDEITEYPRTYIETSLFPFPLLDESKKYDHIQDRFAQPDAVYKKFRNIEDTAKKIGNDFRDLVERGQPGIRMYQVVGIELASLRRAAQQRSKVSLSVVNRQIEDVILTLVPEGDDESTVEDRGSTSDDISLEDGILMALSEDWKTPEQVFKALPGVLQAAVTTEEVREELKELAGLGVISKRDVSSTVEYNSESGSVSLEDVL
jgi:transposase-like protein